MPHARVGSHELHYEIHGETSGTPLLLIVGLGGSSRGWHALQVPDFAAAHRTITYDHRGVGKSHDPGGAFTTADLADDAARLLDAIGAPRAHVLGAFMGGMVAQELALRHPARVDRVVLVGTFARADAKRRMLLEKWKAMVGHGLPLAVIAQERMLWTLSDDTLEQSDLIHPMMQGFLRDAMPMADDVFVRQSDARGVRPGRPVDAAAIAPRARRGATRIAPRDDSRRGASRDGRGDQALQPDRAAFSRVMRRTR
jgi:pimeloyl-ACP methyl ester carboxylesterase